MKINKASATGYNSVNTENIYRYMNEYATYIYYAITQNENRITAANRTRLKSIAANLETIEKELKYIIEGEY